MLDATGAFDGLVKGTGALRIGTGLLVGPTGAQESFGLAEVGVLGVRGLLVDVERAKAGLDALFEALAVKRMD